MRTIKGFTLIEMIIVMLVTGIVVAGVSLMLSAGFTNYFTGVKVTALTTQATLAMARMTKELQEASSFSAINATNVTFTTTDGATISYSWSSPILKRTGISAQTLSDQVTDFSLSYYQSDFTATTTLKAVRAVTINITLSNGSEIVPIINTVFLSDM
ncbi:type II secretion system protein [Legionella sainthelensi]|uniref:Prepilin-type N-terminal cleavage/methylation domain-containing protein n=1 Tax=Legionella sainthelensi TaxID=28087 RepID=A0A2H5FKA0_9GAMM|nr:type II secretion system protein [Legionella sainthelensi]AUH71955.1 type II secretion system protein [Legionella sainthelensi]